MPKEIVVGRIGKYKVVKTDYSDLTWTIDVLFKNQYIESLNRKDLISLNILLLSVLSLLSKKSKHIKIIPRPCTVQYPFNVNICLYMIQKLENLKILLEAEFDDIAQTIKDTANNEKNELEVLKQFDEFETFVKSLTEENTLKFVLKEAKVEKTIDLKLIKNIVLIYNEHLKDLQNKSQYFFEISGKKNNSYARDFESLKAFQPKFEKMIEALEKLHNKQ